MSISPSNIPSINLFMFLMRLLLKIVFNVVVAFDYNDTLTNHNLNCKNVLGSFTNRLILQDRKLFELMKQLTNISAVSYLILFCCICCVRFKQLFKSFIQGSSIVYGSSMFGIILNNYFPCFFSAFVSNKEMNFSVD